jgi:hypothetical protein
MFRQLSQSSMKLFSPKESTEPDVASKLCFRICLMVVGHLLFMLICTIYKGTRRPFQVSRTASADEIDHNLASDPFLHATHSESNISSEEHDSASLDDIHPLAVQQREEEEEENDQNAHNPSRRSLARQLLKAESTSARYIPPSPLVISPQYSQSQTPLQTSTQVQSQKQQQQQGRVPSLSSKSLDFNQQVQRQQVQQQQLTQQSQSQSQVYPYPSPRSPRMTQRPPSSNSYATYSPQSVLTPHSSFELQQQQQLQGPAGRPLSQATTGGGGGIDRLLSRSGSQYGPVMQTNNVSAMLQADSAAGAGGRALYPVSLSQSPPVESRLRSYSQQHLSPVRPVSVLVWRFTVCLFLLVLSLIMLIIICLFPSMDTRQCRTWMVR